MSDATVTLERAAARYEAAHEQVNDIGEFEAEALSEAYITVTRVLDEYEERATDWDDFEGYIRFREAIGETYADIDDDLPHYDAFVAADDHLTSPASRPLSTDDFVAAREALGPVRAVHEAYTEYEDATAALDRARYEARSRLDDLDEHIADLERLQRLGQVDLDAPVEVLRDPIETYNQAVRRAFDAFTHDAPAREVLAFVETTSSYPLVEFGRPPSRLVEYVNETPAGEKPLPDLLDLADYSRSKLDHYVDDPAELKAAVEPSRTFLDRLSADPLTVDWPPRPADELRHRIRELVSVVGRFSDEPIPALRDVRDLTRDERYDLLREAAIARTELDESERERVVSGAVGEELDEVRAEREQLVATLDEYGG